MPAQNTKNNHYIASLRALEKKAEKLAQSIANHSYPQPPAVNPGFFRKLLGGGAPPNINDPNTTAYKQIWAAQLNCNSAANALQIAKTASALAALEEVDLETENATIALQKIQRYFINTPENLFLEQTLFAIKQIRDAVDEIKHELTTTIGTLSDQDRNKITADIKQTQKQLTALNNTYANDSYSDYLLKAYASLNNAIDLLQNGNADTHLPDVVGYALGDLHMIEVAGNQGNSPISKDPAFQVIRQKIKSISETLENTLSKK